MEATAEQVRALEDGRYAAMIAGDLAALEGMSAEDLAYTHSSGVTDNRTSYLETMRAGKIKYRQIERLEATVAMAGDAAWLTGRIKLDVLFDTGPTILDSRYLSVWIRVARDWRHLAWHSTSLPAWGQQRRFHKTSKLTGTLTLSACAAAELGHRGPDHRCAA